MTNDKNANESSDEFDNLVLDESFVRAARKRERDADFRVAQAAQIAAEHQRLDAEGKIFAPIPADSPAIRRRSRVWRNRLLWAAAIIAPVAIVIGALLAR
ncbi:MAG: hypothetical protein Q8P61_09095 [Candidatus Nanopelagicales bacterium]|nr:hypothetical protein [Candidatus Nanopelagicales bacterium]